MSKDSVGRVEIPGHAVRAIRKEGEYVQSRQ
jgi:hypothetical protein